MIRLKEAQFSDISLIQSLQKECFYELYQRYGDVRNPYLETTERIEEKFNRPTSRFYFLVLGETIIGFLRIWLDEELQQGWLSRIAVLPHYQNNGYAQDAIAALEERYPQIHTWVLTTIFQEKGLVAFYERCGYRQTDIENEQAGMDIVQMVRRMPGI